jgi:hypothetical protein
MLLNPAAAKTLLLSNEERNYFNSVDHPLGARCFLMQTQEEMVAEQATGCRDAGGYRRWAEAQGYTHCEVYEWTSSAGDWTFLVSRDGEEWFIMSQENNYPRGSGFSRSVNELQPFYGAFEEVCREVEMRYA